MTADNAEGIGRYHAAFPGGAGPAGEALTTVLILADAAGSPVKFSAVVANARRVFPGEMAKVTNRDAATFVAATWCAMKELPIEAASFADQFDDPELLH